MAGTVKVCAGGGGGVSILPLAVAPESFPFKMGPIKINFCEYVPRALAAASGSSATVNTFAAALSSSSLHLRRKVVFG